MGMAAVLVDVAAHADPGDDGNPNMADLVQKYLFASAAGHSDTYI